MSNIDLRYEWEPSTGDPDGYHVFLCRPQRQCEWEHYITLATPTVRIVQPFDENAPRAIRVQGFKGASVSEMSPPQSNGFPVVPLPEPSGILALLIGCAILAWLGRKR
jgi:hypothetical protein